VEVETSQPLPRRFGPYTLLRPLSRGGMGDVFLARAGAIAGAERLSVVKTLRPELAQDEEYLSRFVEEARVAVTMNHAGVCHVFDAGRVGDVLYLAMEYIAGVNVTSLLAELKSRNKSLAVPHALYIAIELLEALDYAHQRRHPETGEVLAIIHRDVSPQNVMVSFEGEVKLIDFGLATKAKDQPLAGDAVMGKVSYMSPEQARGLPLDGRTDQFSAAIVIFEMLTGRRFYGDKSKNEVLALAARGGFLPAQLESIDKDVAAVVLRALSAERTDRFPTCGAMASALRLVLARVHPLMGRSLLKQFIEDVLPGFADESRTRLRDLPASLSGTVDHPSEPTQSFAMSNFAALPDTLQLAPATVTAPADTNETALVRERTNPRGGTSARPRTPALAIAAAAVVVAAVAVVAVIAQRPRVDTPLPPPNPIAHTAVVDAGTQPVEVMHVVDAGPPIAEAAHLVDADEPPVVDPSSSSKAHASHVAKAHDTKHETKPHDAKPATHDAKPSTPSRALTPAEITARKRVVLACDVSFCKSTKEKLQANEDVAIPVLNSCFEACTK
jgi:serine/threonine protein kinase